jgi:hypothetical protein
MWNLEPLQEISSVDEVRYSQLDADQLKVYRRLERLSPDTQRNYLARFRNFIHKRRVGHPTTRHSERTLRSAIQFGYDLNCLVTCPELRSAWEQRRYSWEISGRPLHSDKLELNWWDVADQPNPYRIQVGNSTRRRSRLRQLPSNWWMTTIEHCDTSGVQLQAAMILLFLTGCRPGEVSTARFERLPDHGLLVRLVCSKRRHIQDGVSYRDLTLKADETEQGTLVSRLIFLLYDNHVVGQMYANDAKALQNLCTRLSAKLWPKLRPGLNPSCYRALFIADLKADGVTRGAIAYLAGHTSERTASYYGLSKQGTRGRRAYLSIPETSTHQERVDVAARMRAR